MGKFRRGEEAKGSEFGRNNLSLVGSVNEMGKGRTEGKAAPTGLEMGEDALGMDS